jgi:hypothetical protein
MVMIRKPSSDEKAVVGSDMYGDTGSGVPVDLKV